MHPLDYTVKTAFQSDLTIEQLATAMNVVYDSGLIRGTGCVFDAAPSHPQWRWVTFNRNLKDDIDVLLERIAASNFNLSTKQVAMDQIVAELLEYDDDDPLVKLLVKALSPQWGTAEVKFPPATRN